MTDYEKSARRMSNVSKRVGVTLALIMAAAVGWEGFHERRSLPDFQKNEAQYLAERRPAALTASMRDQYTAFQSEFCRHSFDKQGALAVTLDPNSPATQADVEKRVTADFNAEVRNKKFAPYLAEPFAALFLAVASIPLWEARRRKNPQPRPSFSSLPPREID